MYFHFSRLDEKSTDESLKIATKRELFCPGYDVKLPIFSIYRKEVREYVCDYS